MTIDINAIVSAIIAEEVNSHMTGLMQAYANKMGELHARITHLDAHIGHLNARIGSLEAVPVDEIPDDYFKRDALTNQFIEKLNNQEWFWDKVNRYVDEHIERVYGAPINQAEAAIIAKDTFDAEWNKKVGSNDLLGRDEVGEVIKELWDEDYRTEVEDIAESAVTDHDFEDQIKRALRDATISFGI
jgi:hypothetical protein